MKPLKIPLQTRDDILTLRLVMLGLKTWSLKTSPLFLIVIVQVVILSNFLNRRYMKWCVHAEADLKMAEPGFQTPIGQDVSTALILFQGNMTVNNRRRLGVLTGITT